MKTNKDIQAEIEKYNIWFKNRMASLYGLQGDGRFDMQIEAAKIEGKIKALNWVLEDSYENK